MEEHQIEIIRTTSYQMLTEAQREEMKDWFSSEEEFLDLQHLFVGVQSYKESSEKEQSTRKNELDKLFVQVNSKKPAFNWKNFFFPAFRPIILQRGFQLAFGLLFLLGTGYYLNSNFQTSNTKLQAKNSKAKNEKIETPKKVNEDEKANFEIKDKLQKLSEEPISIASTNNLKENFVIEDMVSIGIADFESSSYTAIASEYMSMDASVVLSEKDFEKQINSNQPISAQPEILDLLFTTY